MSKIIPAEHGIVYARPDDDPFGYFGWPTAAKGENGEIRVVVSGFRAAHVCPFGKTVLFRSADEGKTWSAPAVIGNSMIDDRDAGILPLPGGKALVSWFTSDTRTYFTGKETFRISIPCSRAGTIPHPWKSDRSSAFSGRTVPSPRGSA